MDDWEDIDEYEGEEEEEAEILDYCAECDEPIYDGDNYTLLDCCARRCWKSWKVLTQSCTAGTSAAGRCWTG